MMHNSGPVDIDAQRAWLKKTEESYDRAMEELKAANDAHRKATSELINAQGNCSHWKREYERAKKSLEELEGLENLSEVDLALLLFHRDKQK